MITTQKYYNYINEKNFKTLCMQKCVNVMYIIHSNDIKNKIPPPPPPDSLFPLAWLLSILYNKVNKVINIIQINYPQCCV